MKYRIVISLFSVIAITSISSLIISSYAAKNGHIKPFTSDGCSAFPNGTFTQQNLWLSCCIVHDKLYWQGGTYQQRLKADQHLEKCVANIGQPKIAKLMLAGVRVGGSPYLPTKFRWGYGWKYPRFYKKLTKGELAQIEKIRILD